MKKNCFQEGRHSSLQKTKISLPVAAAWSAASHLALAGKSTKSTAQHLRWRSPLFQANQMQLPRDLSVRRFQRDCNGGASPWEHTGYTSGNRIRSWEENNYKRDIKRKKTLTRVFARCFLTCCKTTTDYEGMFASARHTMWPCCLRPHI